MSQKFFSDFMLQLSDESSGHYTTERRTSVGLLSSENLNAFTRYSLCLVKSGPGR